MEKNLAELLANHYWIIIIVLLWTLPWKAAALWRSARRAQLGWFLVMTVINTLGILEILYIFFFSKNDSKVGSEKVSKSQSKFKLDKNELEEKINKKIIM
jgi:hypothetical protein